MAAHMISALLTGSVPVGETVTIKGWVRTRRDSKAGLSFVAVHDGTAFDAISGQEWVFEIAQFRREIDAWKGSVAEAKEQAQPKPRGVRSVEVQDRTA